MTAYFGTASSRVRAWLGPLSCMGLFISQLIDTEATVVIGDERWERTAA